MLGLCTRNEVFVYVDAHVHSKAHTDIHWYERMYAHTHTQAIHTHTHLHMNTRTHMHTNAYTHYLCFILLLPQFHCVCHLSTVASCHSIDSDHLTKVLHDSSMFSQWFVTMTTSPNGPLKMLPTLLLPLVCAQDVTH